MVAIWRIAVAAICLIMSGTFAGLTLGLLTLDLVDLRVLTESGTAEERQRARCVMTVRKHGNFLLCTLLTGNTAANALLSIVLAELTSGLVGFAVSTLLILFLGEILPQSVGHRYGLRIGSALLWLVKIFMILFAPLTFPTSKVLDYFMGTEPHTRYNKRALKALVDIQSRQNAAAAVAAAAEQDGRSVNKRARRRRRGRGRQRGVGAGIKRLFGGDSEGERPAAAGASNATAGDVEQGLPSPSATVAIDTATAPTAGTSQEAAAAVTPTAEDTAVRRPSEGSAYDAGSRAMLVAGAIGATYAAAASTGHPTDQLTWEEGLILGGALEFTSKTVEQIMTPLNKVFMLSAKARLNFKTMTIIFQSGHSRIPVYAQRRGNVVGVLFTKDLILIDPDDDIPVSTVLSFFRRELRRVMANVHLNVLLNEFKSGRGHMAVVQRPHDPAAVGIVTLEDVIEEIIQSEIVDETDVYRDNVRDEVVVRKRRIDAELLRMLDSSPRDERFLTEQEIQVIATYLASNFEEDFGPERISPALLAKMLAVSPIVEYDRGSARGGHAASEAALSRPRMSPTAATTVNPTAAAAVPALDALPNASTAFGAEALSEGEVEDDEEAVERERRWRLLRRRSASFGEGVDADRLGSDWAALPDGDARAAAAAAEAGNDRPAELYLYRRGVPAHHATLILSGHVEVLARGSPAAASEAGPWTLLARGALKDELYVADFSARALEYPLRLLRISTRQYKYAVRMSAK